MTMHHLRNTTMVGGTNMEDDMQDGMAIDGLGVRSCRSADAMWTFAKMYTTPLDFWPVVRSGCWFYSRFGMSVWAIVFWKLALVLLPKSWFSKKLRPFGKLFERHVGTWGPYVNLSSSTFLLALVLVPAFELDAVSCWCILTLPPVSSPY